VRVSVCHCLACQARTGSAFGAQARFPAENVELEGGHLSFVRTADSGRKVEYRFCPRCGSTVTYAIEDFPELVAVPLGAFGAADFPPPLYSIYESRKLPWLAIESEVVQHLD
jgi:hypothetical protein